MSRSLRVDRVIHGVGRIARYIGSADPAQRDMCNQAITRLARKRRWDVLQAFRDGEIDPETLFLAAHAQVPLPAVKAARAVAKRDPEKDCFVYAILRADTREVKLGIARDVQSRLRGLQIACAVPLQLLGTMVGGPDAELSLHEQFAHLRLCGEWFRYTDELAAFIKTEFSAKSIQKSHYGSGAHKSPAPVTDARPTC